MGKSRAGLILGFLACSACMAGPSQVGAASKEPKSLTPVPDGLAVKGSADSSDSYETGETSRAIWNGGMVQGSVRWDANRTIHYECREADPSENLTGFAYVTVGDWSTSYDIVDVIGGMGPHRFVVHGVAKNGDSVFELFTLKSQVGGYEFTPLSSGCGGFGVGIAGGGTYLVPAARVPLAPPRRVELYRGSSLGTDLLSTITPDGSMLYVLSRADRHLWCVPRDSALSSVEYPLGSGQDLLAGAKEMGMRRQAGEGDKVYIFVDYGSLPLSVLIISDYDGDRYLDADELMDTAQYKALGYPGLWATDYTSDPDVIKPY